MNKHVHNRLPREAIKQKLLQNRKALKQRGVKRLGIFGSYALGTTNRRSDLDFLVELDVLSFDKYMDVKLFLEDLFGRRIDLVTLGSIKARLRPHILKEVKYVSGL